ncbi:MAG: rhodanese-like domain-containing protein [Elusimicrobia bacterium]|nr:rhodanese-like domain-containing protein [Elusimicrobiota bacterium]
MFIALPALMGAAAFGQELVLPERLRQLQVDKGSFTLVDVRDVGQYQIRHIDGAINIPKDAIGSADLPKGGRIILYCGDAHCPLSHAAAKTLMSNGVENIGVLYGGIAQWEKSGYPVLPVPIEKEKVKGDIDAGELQDRIHKTGAVVVVDVRSAEDFTAGHLPGARSIPLENLSKSVKSLRKHSDIVVYDRVSQRSKTAVRQLAEAGVGARALAGGVGAWAMKGFPLEAGSQKGS